MLQKMLRSGHKFLDTDDVSKNKFQMLNIAIILSTLALFFGMMANIIREKYEIIPVEILLISVNIILFFILRKNRNTSQVISSIITTQFSFLFLALVYIYEPNDLKHIWLFTYPIILLYFQNTRSGFYWIAFMIVVLYILPIQPFIETQYSLFQVTYLSFVLLIVSLIMYFYKKEMDEARGIILKQQYELQNFNTELEVKVEQKTVELQDLNESLEMKVKEKIKELIAKDELLTVQSKQAVMGEMISMIAHQWRQPLSTITLQISNLHFKRLLGENVPVAESDKTLRDISDTIVYLSDTIDDFQTYFRPQKEKEREEVNTLLERAINFVKPRMKEIDIQIINDKENDIFIQTYDNEMVQVILNLINNSLDAFIEFEKVNAKLYVYAEEDEETVRIYVKDNAGGISSENIAQVFEPYFSTKGKNGTGLGLYMSQMIVEKQFGGVIRVESCNGETTFIVEITKLLS
ncbi:MAG: C4-dicarboxylate-specific signal transduction histidine kinase [Sulfurimonas sp.]|jgi:C4-dicarboxylate-specific signal transduction histidine kinase|uniref:sensor histidine kinase n=1 Tax=Sulfurimonas sp. TaxID=2022749 RepID=UPI0039E670C6